MGIRTIVDPRDAYCGAYTCQCLIKHFGAGITTIVTDTVVVKVTVQKDATDSVFNLQTYDKLYTVKLLGERFISFNDSRCSGRFSNDSLYMDYQPSRGPGQWKYIGKK